MVFSSLPKMLAQRLLECLGEPALKSDIEREAESSPREELEL